MATPEMTLIDEAQFAAKNAEHGTAIAAARTNAVADAKTYTDGQVATDRGRLGTLEGAGYVAPWKASTAYANAQRVVSPDGDIVTAKAAFTSGATYDAANWYASNQSAKIIQSTAWMGEILTGGDLNTATGKSQRVSLYEIRDYGVGIANMPPNPYQGHLETLSNIDGRRIIQRVTYDASGDSGAGVHYRRGVDGTGGGVFVFSAWTRVLNDTDLTTLNASIASLNAVAPVPEENRTILSDMATGWVAGPTTYATFNMAVASDAVLSANAVSITTNGTGQTGYVDLTAIPAFSMAGRGLVIWLKADNVESISSVSVKVSSSNTFTAAYGASLPVAAGAKSPLKNGEWFPIYMPPGQMYVNNGSPNIQALTAFRITLQDINGLPAPTLTIGGLATYAEKNRKYPRGVVSLTFDDTYVSHATLAAPYLAKYGFPATEYLIQSRVDTGGNLSKAQLHKLRDAYGWEIAAHASNDAAHTDWTLQTTAWVDTELTAQKDWQKANGFYTDTFAYPIGPFNSDLARRVSPHYKSARSTYSWTNSSRKPHVYRLSSNVVTAASTLAALQPVLDRVVANGGWVVLMFHNIVASGATGNDVNTSVFNSIIDAVAATGLPVATVGDVISSTA